MNEGLHNGQIADRLVVSVRTVDHHVEAILRKLGAKTRADARATATSLGKAERNALDGASPNGTKCTIFPAIICHENSAVTGSQALIG